MISSQQQLGFIYQCHDREKSDFKIRSFEVGNRH